MVPDFIGDVTLFCDTFRHKVAAFPSFPEPDVRLLRQNLIREEVMRELMPALAYPAPTPRNDPSGEKRVKHLASIVDGIADSIYVIVGTAIAYGLPLAKVWAAVQAANMAKLWTEEEVKAITPEMKLKAVQTNYQGKYAVYNEAGKVVKPASWRPPDVEGIVAQAIREAGGFTPVEEQDGRRSNMPAGEDLA